jgi:hypothetical protein
MKPLSTEIFASPCSIKTYVLPQDIPQWEIARLANGLKPKSAELIDSKVEFVWLCGLYRYRDSVPRDIPVEYETRFCYLYIPSETGDFTWRLGPAEYNQTTQHQS